MLDHIAFAEEKPTEYRILSLSVRPLAVDKKTRQEIQENNPAFRFAVQVRAVVPGSGSPPGRRLRHQHHSADYRSRCCIPSDHVARLPVWLSSAVRRRGGRDNIERSTKPNHPGDMISIPGGKPGGIPNAMNPYESISPSLFTFRSRFCRHSPSLVLRFYCGAF